jgi:hypothetical protein
MISISPELLSKSILINVQLDERDQQRQEYGIKFLGSCIGTDQYILDQLNNHPIDLGAITEKLLDYLSLLLLLKVCASLSSNSPWPC